MIRVSDLERKKVIDADGKPLGRVYEVHTENGEVTALICGVRGILQRLSHSSKGRRIPWENVASLAEEEIRLK